MKRVNLTIILVATALLAVCAMSAFAQDVKKIKYPQLNPLEIPKVEKVTLENGMRLYLLQDPSLPILHISVRINCGGYLEPADKIGLASICGNVMRTGGTAKWTGDQLDEALESVGGSVETSIGMSSGSAGVNVLSDYTDLGLQALSEVLRHPAFDKDKIELAKVQEKAGIARRNDDATSIGRREFMKAIYGAQSVYARQTEYKTIDNISRDDLLAYHAAFFHPENVQMAIWGDFDKTQLIDKIKQYFGDWEKGTITVPPLPKVDYKFGTKVLFVQKSDVNQSNVYLGHIGGLIRDPDYASRIVMNNVLGGSFGSRLFNNVRSKEGLAYSAYGVYSANIAYPGVFYNYAATKSESTVKAIKEIINQIHRMKTDAPTPEEMSVGKDGYLNSFVFNFDSRAKVVNRLMSYEFYGLPEDFLQKEKTQVEKVTPQDVVAAAQKNLRPDSLIVLVVGKGEDFVEGLDKLGLGKVDTVDISIPSAEVKKELSITPETLAKGKELLAKAVAAHGGLANYKKVKSTSGAATLTISTPQGDFPISQNEITVYPDKAKQTMSVMGRTMISVLDGKTGWKTDPSGKVADLSSDELAELSGGITRDPIYIFMTSDKPANQIVYSGADKVGDYAVENIAVVSADGKTLCTIAIDAKTSRLVASSHYGRTMAGEGKIEGIYSDFKTVNGILVPMAAKLDLGGQKASMTFSEFKVNPVVPADAFAKPK